MAKVAINGFGRIGRPVLKQILARTDLDVVLINDLTDNKTLATLFKYDSVHGKFDGTVDYDDENIIINGKKIKCTAEKDPSKLPYKDLGVEYVIESTGVFRTEEKMKLHIQAGAKKVLLSAPAKGGDVKTFVIGVNDDQMTGSEELVSNASCTTNCLAPIVKILDEKFGIETGFVNTIHAFTMDQNVLDAPHSDLRRARAAAVNIIPTTTGAAKAVALVYPKMEGKLDGAATRVPVPDGSLCDFYFTTNSKIDAETVNKTIKEAANGSYKGVVEYNEDPIVSSDIVGNQHSSIFDSGSTKILGNLVRVVAWYDNEFGYSNRIVDMAVKIFK